MVCIPIQAKFPRLRKQVKLSKKMIGTLLIGCLLNNVSVNVGCYLKIYINMYLVIMARWGNRLGSHLTLDLSTSKT